MCNEAIKVYVNFRVESTPFCLERVNVNNNTQIRNHKYDRIYSLLLPYSTQFYNPNFSY